MNTVFDVLLQWGPHRGPHGPAGPHGPMGPDGWTGAGMMPWGGAGATGLGFLWSLVAVLLVVAVLAVFVYLAVRVYGETESDGDDALSVLRRRYAAGEIDDDEFERRRTRLDGGPLS